MTQLRASLSRLMAMRWESNERMADMSPFWMLNVLNSAELVLGQYLRLQHSPPSTVVPTLMGAASCQQRSVSDPGDTRTAKHLPTICWSCASKSAGCVKKCGMLCRWF